MSVRSAGRGRAAARSIRLALRSLSIVATKSASLPRRVFRCRGSRCASSASIPAASRSIPLIPIPAQSITGRGQHARSTPSTKLMDGKDLGDQHEADLAQADRGDEALEAEALLAAGSRQAEVVIDDADVGVRPAHLPRPLDQSVLAAGALLVVEHLLRRRLPDVDEGAQTGVARLHLGRAAHGASAPPEPCGSTGAGAAGRPTAPPWGRAPRSAGWPRWSGSSP